MDSSFIVLSKAGKNRDLTKDTREQPYWDEHAKFIDGLIDSGIMFLGGPLPDEGGACIVVKAKSVEEVRKILQLDPWYQNEILTLDTIKRWEIFVDTRN